MTKYSKGKTSKEVLEKSKLISKCIQSKSRLLIKALEDKEIPKSLHIEKNRINLADIHKWSDKDLNIFAYARNTADTPQNHKTFEEIKITLSTINYLMRKNLFEKESSTHLHKKEDNLKVEFENIKNVTCEIYRCYLQLIDFCNQHGFEDLQYKELIKKQQKVLSTNKLEMLK